jgi:hypothetical protein
MNHTLRRILLLVFVIVLATPIQAFGLENKEDPEEIFQLLKKAFEAQVSLSVQDRTLDEVEAILNPYFTDRYMKMFLDENLVENNGKYATLGSDFALYFIPFFDYSTKTKVKTYNQQLYVYQYFPASDEGPVSYESHYEGLLLEKEAGVWKVSEYLHDFIPKQVFEISLTPLKGNRFASINNLLFPFTFREIDVSKPIDLFSKFQTLIIKQGKIIN